MKYELLGHPAYGVSGQPQLVKDHPELISVILFGKREIISRDFYDHVKALASGPPR